MSVPAAAVQAVIGEAEDAVREAAEAGRLREEAEKALGVLAARAVMVAVAAGGSVLDCFALVADPRDPAGSGTGCRACWPW